MTEKPRRYFLKKFMLARTPWWRSLLRRSAKNVNAFEKTIPSNKKAAPFTGSGFFIESL
jgi:hypothetical protein